VDRRKTGEAKAWAGYFLNGRDFFDDLDDVGLTDKTAAPVAEETWHRIGYDVLRHLEEMHVGFAPLERPIWAESEWGSPNGGRKRPGTARRRR
jgi:hypothetical protein